MSGGFPEFEFDRYFLQWFEKVKCSIFLSSYKTNMVLGIGMAKKKEEKSKPLPMYFHLAYLLLSTNGHDCK